jgi:hypothetical protein
MTDDIDGPLLRWEPVLGPDDRRIRGVAGHSISLFVYWDDDDRPRTRWILKTYLPGWTGKRWRETSEDRVQLLAERLLERWLAFVLGEAA